MRAVRSVAHTYKHRIVNATTVRQKKMNNYSCFLSASNGIPVTFSLPISAVSLLPSLTTVIFVCILKLHKTLVYRLALYQVLSAMEFSFVWIAAAVNQLSPALINESFSDNVSYPNGSYHLDNGSHLYPFDKPVAVAVFEALLAPSL